MSDKEKKDNIEENEEKKEIEVVKGNGSDLNISTVYEHVKLDNPNDDDNNHKDKKIVIPKK